MGPMMLGNQPENYFPPAPTMGANPLGRLGLFGQGKPSGDRDELRKRIASMISGQGTPQNVGQGLGAIMTGIAAANARRNAAFPQAPGGAQPSFATSLRNFFTAGNNGGLY
ncbi:hypothetical protein OCK02_02130 [Rhizobium sp. TRM96647]|uniref:hypothetical protein n=1 Tax=unclassified Rhizobium TaxID=2613769 RepID=UPI0021E809AE|nr:MULTISPECIES: hypothetical protein [unclassified Rhizobium]MCV3734987.1 hypothetical protein [Rhizobium sp. TRM96647]MCV3757357.1 hypothetical protein [Rhizobium sp. TRM96650]